VKSLIEQLACNDKPSLIRAYQNKTFYVFFKENNNIEGYALSPWPELKSYKLRSDGSWVQEKSAYIKVFEYFSINELCCYFNPYENKSDIKAGFILIKNTWVEENGQMLLPKIAEVIFPERILLSIFNSHWKDFQSTIPNEIRCLIKRFKINPMRGFRLLSSIPECLSLIRHHPSLYLMLTLKFHDSDYSELIAQDIRSILATRDILKLMDYTGIVPSKATLRFLDRIPIKMLRTSKIKVLSELIQQPYFGHSISHIKYFSETLLEVLSIKEMWPLVTPQLIICLGRRNYIYGDDYWKDIAAIILKNEHKRFRSLKELDFAGLSEKYDTDLQFFKKNKLYPNPPISPLSDFLIPIDKYDDLQNEGVAQNNCVSIEHFIDDVEDGKKYFYKTSDIHSERLTVMIERSSDSDSWVITEIRLKDNVEPRISTIIKIVNALGIPAQPIWYPKNPVWSLGQYAFPVV